MEERKKSPRVYIPWLSLFASRPSATTVAILRAHDLHPIVPGLLEGTGATRPLKRHHFEGHASGMTEGDPGKIGNSRDRNVIRFRLMSKWYG